MFTDSLVFGAGSGDFHLVEAVVFGACLPAKEFCAVSACGSGLPFDGGAVVSGEIFRDGEGSRAGIAGKEIDLVFAGVPFGLKCDIPRFR